MKRTVFADGRFADAVDKAWTSLPAHFGHVSLDAFVVMPNHFHGIVWIHEQPAAGYVDAQHVAPQRRDGRHLPRVLPGSLGAIVRSFKAASTKTINELRGSPGGTVWQRNYYDRIVRNEDELNRIRQYIIDNPLKWATDPENPERVRDTGYERMWGWLESPTATRLWP